MATLFISEFVEFADIGTEVTQVAPLPPVGGQQIAVGATAAPSAAFSGRTGLIRVVADVSCAIAIGTTISVANAVFLPANVPEFFVVVPGQVLSVQAAS